MKINGQITPDSFAGNEIIKIINRIDIKNIVESGTWLGGGSTMCVLENLREDQIFKTIELYPDIFKQARKNLANYIGKPNFEMLEGSIVEFKEMFYFNHIEVLTDISIREHANLYFLKDLNYLKTCENVLYKIPEKIDFLILDGGEWSTYPEWNKLKARTRIVFLDDTTTFKTKKIRQEILEDENYKTIIDKTNCSGFRNFGIFERIS